MAKLILNEHLIQNTNNACTQKDGTHTRKESRFTLFHMKLHNISHNQHLSGLVLAGDHQLLINVNKA